MKKKTAPQANVKAKKGPAAKAKKAAPKASKKAASAKAANQCVMMFAFEDFENPEMGNIEIKDIKAITEALVAHSLAKKLPLQITIEPQLKLLSEEAQG